MDGYGGDSFANTICSICFEDLKPIVEDLQAISICGHVFHELCLQQWLEYCPNTKKQTCPICKQGCSKKSVSRLYFQSVGERVLSQSRPVVSQSNENPELLRREVKRLESKAASLDVVLEHNQKQVKELTDELCICKNKLTREVTIRTDALTQKKSIEEMLRTKSNELVTSNLECRKLQEKCLALAKELASLKLVSDCNLEEEEIVKLASLGNESNKDTIDVLKKSLVIRNKSYKDLMAKCNTLGRGEAHSLRKLEKAKEKITKLKARIKELETTMEEKDNEVLRMIKASKLHSKFHERTSHPSALSKHAAEDQNKEPTPYVINLDVMEDENLFCDSLGMKEKHDCHPALYGIKDGNTVDHDKSSDSTFLDDDDAPYKSRTFHDTSDAKMNEGLASKGRLLRECSTKKDTDFSRHHGQSGTPCLTTVIKGDINDYAAAEGTVLQLDRIRQVQPSFHRNESSSPLPLADPGDICFSGGFLGPDGSSRHLGKWCKRGSNKGSTISRATQNLNSGSLIAVGADGKSGRVKVLRSINQSSLDGKESQGSAKRCKSGAKTSSNQAQGCLQIEHFFGKTTN